MALTTIKTGAISDDAVTEDKIANAINTARAANTAKDLTALSASNLTSGTVPDARFPATLPAASAANLTSVPAGNITGTLPAISAANLTSIPAANITGTLPAISGANLTGISSAGKAHNLVINGSMNVAQRGTSSTSTYYQTVDRFQLRTSGVDEAPTQAQVDVASGTTPFTLGFRKAYRITNGNQTSGAGAGDYVFIRCMLEAQDIATSGWNYVSSSSNITFSFWVKSSVAQNFYCSIYTKDGTSYSYPFETGSLSADTWTKITKTLPGNSNLQFDNDVNEGLRINFFCFQGTDKTGTVTLNQWSAFADAAQTPDSTSTWYTTNDSTFEITGVQLEVGDSATDFAHESYQDTLLKCQRYCFKGGVQLTGSSQSDGGTYLTVQTPVFLRTDPTLVSFSASLRGSVMAEAAGASFNNAVAPRVTVGVSNTGTANTLVGGVNGKGDIHLDSEL